MSWGTPSASVINPLSAQTKVAGHVSQDEIHKVQDIPQTPTVEAPGPTFSLPLPIERFRLSVRKVMHITKNLGYLTGKAWCEPGIDIRRDSAYLNYGHIRQNCLIEIAELLQRSQQLRAA